MGRDNGLKMSTKVFSRALGRMLLASMVLVPSFAQAADVLLIKAKQLIDTRQADRQTRHTHY